MRLRILGSGTLRPDPHRGAPGYWLEGKGASILLDCGSGSLHTLARLGLGWEGVSHVLLTHFHTDHVADLAPLLFALKHGIEPARTQPLTILGPSGLRRHLNFLAEAHGAHVRNPGFPLEVEELSPGAPWTSDGGFFRLWSYATNHTENSLAFRVETKEGSIGITGDTGPDPGLGAFLEGVQLLVAECSNPDGEGLDTHLTPSGLAALASKALPDLLVNVHAYPPLDPEEVPELLRGMGYVGRAIAGRDGMVIRLSQGGVPVEASQG